MEKIIDNEFKITSILARGYYTNYLTASIVEQFKNKEVLLWQDKNYYHSCKRLQLCFGHDLIELLKEFSDEFEVLIIDRFREGINVQDTINFIKTISKMEKMKNKQFIFIFSALTNNAGIYINDFENLKDVILEHSDRLYSLQRYERSIVFENRYDLRNLDTDEVLCLRETRKGSGTMLDIIEEEKV